MKTPAGIDRLRDPRQNKGTAFTREERERFGLQGLLPPAVTSIQVQEQRVLDNLQRMDSDFDRYIYLSGLQLRNERLFFYVLIQHLEALMPVIYTPTVGEACRQFHRIFQQPRGLYISYHDRGELASILANWPDRDVDLIVVTDGERILGLGDMGANGMGIPIGKVALYCACAGIPPWRTLPVMIDVGTGNEVLRNDPLYSGINAPRPGDDASYLALLDEFMSAVQDRFPGAVVQFEDFATENARSLLWRYGDRYPCFNDDIQGTATVVLAGLYAACRKRQKPLQEMQFLFLGAGSAAVGIAQLLCRALQRQGLSAEEAVGRVHLVDRSGLITHSRKRINSAVEPFADAGESLGLAEAITSIAPDALIGATGSPGSFSREVIETMAAVQAQPIIIALSNPTSYSECTAEQAYQWSEGRALYASGSPFAAVTLNGTTHVPGQANNAFVFPGIGLGAVISRTRTVTDDMLLQAAATLSEQVSDDDLERGSLYPSIADIRAISCRVAVAIATAARQQGVARIDGNRQLDALVGEYQYQPDY